MRIQLKANNAGRLISRGRGGHISRIIRNWELIFVLKSRLEMFVGGKVSMSRRSIACFCLPESATVGEADIRRTSPFSGFTFFRQTGKVNNI